MTEWQSRDALAHADTADTIEDLFRSERHRLARYFGQKVRNREDVTDLVQETLLCRNPLAGSDSVSRHDPSQSPRERASGDYVQTQRRGRRFGRAFLIAIAVRDMGVSPSETGQITTTNITPNRGYLWTDRPEPRWMRYQKKRLFSSLLADAHGRPRTEKWCQKRTRNGPQRRRILPFLGKRYKAIPSPIPSHFFAKKVRVPKAANR